MNMVSRRRPSGRLSCSRCWWERQAGGEIRDGVWSGARREDVMDGGR